jgi:hypothetical protein
MLLQPSHRPPQLRHALLGRVCAQASRIGVWLLPLFYIAYFIALAFFCDASGTAPWLPAAGMALASAMGFWAFVFTLASRMPQVPETVRTTAPMPAVSHESCAQAHELTRMPTRKCVQSWQKSSGTSASFSVACYKEQCSAGQGSTEVPVIYRPDRRHDTA